MRVLLGRGDWYLCDETDQPEVDFEEFQGDEALALQWLDQFRYDMVLYPELRRLFDLPWSAEDWEVRQQIASCLARGVWRARRPVEPIITWAAAAKPDVAAAFPLDERRAPTSSRPSAPDPGIFPDDVDFAAIAAIQREAAELGVPFCEECARAAAAGH